MEDLDDIFEEYPKETKKRFIDILQKEQEHQALSMGEVSMLFFWQNHKSEPRFKFLKDYIKEPKKAHQKAPNKPKTKNKQKKGIANNE